MGSKYDKPLTITVTADDWRLAREEERIQELLQKRMDRLREKNGLYDETYTEIVEQVKDYSCICVVAQALVRQIPSLRGGIKNAVSVNTSSCSVMFRDGAKRGYKIDAEGRKIIDRFDARVKRADGNAVRAPMPPALRAGVEVTLTPSEYI